MKKIILLLFVIILATGCLEKKGSSYQFSWATVNYSTVESKVLTIAKENNPYPSEIDRDQSKLRAEIHELSQKISGLKEKARAKCAKKRIQQQKGSVSRGLEYDRDCLAMIESDQAIADLKQQKDELEQIKKKQYEHEKKVREFATEYSSNLVREYSEERFEIVVNNSRNNILYNKKGVSLDITDALMAEIDKNSLFLPGTNLTKSPN